MWRTIAIHVLKEYGTDREKKRERESRYQYHKGKQQQEAWLTIIPSLVNQPRTKGNNGPLESRLLVNNIRKALDIARLSPPLSGIARPT